MEITEDLRCQECKEREADYLLIWKKVYKESGKEGWFRPSIICKPCVGVFLRGDKAFEERPHLISFWDLARYDNAQIGFLLSPKHKEANQLNNEFWKKKLWRIKKITEARRTPTLQQPMAF